jgi:hypothetical protein
VENPGSFLALVEPLLGAPSADGRYCGPVLKRKTDSIDRPSLFFVCIESHRSRQHLGPDFITPLVCSQRLKKAVDARLADMVIIKERTPKFGGCAVTVGRQTPLGGRLVRAKDYIPTTRSRGEVCSFRLGEGAEPTRNIKACLSDSSTLHADTIDVGFDHDNQHSLNDHLTGAFCTRTLPDIRGFLDEKRICAFPPYLSNCRDNAEIQIPGEQQPERRYLRTGIREPGAMNE